MELLVARGAVVSAVRIVIAVALVLGFSSASEIFVPPLSLALPLVALALQIITTYGAGLALAPLSTLYPDLRPGLGAFLTLLMFASPIVYPESALGPRALAVVEWNPFTHLLRLYRFPLEPFVDSVSRDLAWAGGSAALFLTAGIAVKGAARWKARDAL
jgi:ABC-type polysaccharide/polyol phosphate export permease